MSKVYIVDIEAVDTRYTKQWKEHLPIQMRNAGLDVIKVSGGDVPMATTPGAFLNFAGTNNYKAQQMIEISREFAFGNIKDGDYFLYTDAWNPTVIQLKYMAELLGVKIRIGGLWHAGSYDPHDFLGRLIGDDLWVRNAERSMYYCYDDNFFATQFHLNMFLQTMFDVPLDQNFDLNCHIVGWPMEYLPAVMQPYDTVVKKQKIIFPHRLAPEKQVEIFKDLAASMPEYEWFIAQEHNLSKDEYHKHMAESKVMFSANLQETLGISAYEAALVGTYPMVPKRLSYTEMWDETYPNRWVESWKAYQDNKGYLMQFIRNTMERNDLYDVSKEMAAKTGKKFFDGSQLYSIIKSSIAV